MVCPLTAAENYFAYRAGIATYTGDFVTHYLVPVIYQEGLPQRWQDMLAGAVLLLNILAYAVIFLRRRNPSARWPGQAPESGQRSPGIIDRSLARFF